MKAIGKTVLAILFAFAIIEVMVLINKYTAVKITSLGVISVTVAAATLYYFIFERSRKKKEK